MSLNIKYIKWWVFLFLCIPICIQAQELEKETEENQQKKTSDYLFVFYAEGYKPFGVGSNIANDAFQTNFGLKLAYQYNVAFTGILVGPYLNFTSAEIVDEQNVGHYEETAIKIIGLIAGYQYDFDKNWRFYGGIGAGMVDYENSGYGYHFKDEGTSVWLNLKGSYYVTNYFGVYLSGTFRKDILNIEAPEDVRKNFNHSYISLGFGIQFRI